MSSPNGSSSLKTTRFTEPAELRCPATKGAGGSEEPYSRCKLTHDALKTKDKWLRSQTSPDGSRESDGSSTACPTASRDLPGLPDSPLDGFPTVDAREVNQSVKSCMREASENVADWQAADLHFVKTLQSAERNQGRVDLMESLVGGGQFAVKRMPTAWVTRSQEEFEAVHGEQTEQPWFDIAIAKYLQSRSFDYVCQHLGMFRDDLSTYVVSALASEGDAFSWCTKGPSPCLAREGAIKPVIRQMMSAVSWLHDLGIAHRDISLENILLHKDPDTGVLLVKIIDFGMATTSRYGSEVVGKPSYQAPEMHNERIEQYDGFRVDAFSLGVALYALATKDYPWFSTRPGHCRKFEAFCVLGFRAYLERRKAPKSQTSMASVLSPELIDLLEALLSADPDQRVTLGERCWEAASPSSSEEELPPTVWDMAWMEQGR